MLVGGDKEINDLIRTRRVPQGRIVDEDGKNGGDQKAKKSPLAHYSPQVIYTLRNPLKNLECGFSGSEPHLVAHFAHGFGFDQFGDKHFFDRKLGLAMADLVKHF